MKKIITLLTLLILLIDSYKINAEENLETLWVIYENDDSFIFTQNPTKTQVKANYYLKENNIPSKKSYTVYKKAKSTKWCIAACDKTGDKDNIAKDFLNKNFALNKNNKLYSIYYYDKNKQKKEDQDNSPHQIGSSPAPASYRESFLELKDSGMDTTCCKFTYKTNSSTDQEISVLFTNIPQPDSIRVIINFLDDKDNKMNDELEDKDKDKNVIILHKEQVTKRKVNISGNKIKIIEIQPIYPEEYKPILSSLQELKIDINGKEITGNDNSFKIPDNTCDNETTALKICLTLDDIEYKADISLQSPPNKVWLYVICALSVLFISVLVFFVLTIWQ